MPYAIMTDAAWCILPSGTLDNFTLTRSVLHQIGQDHEASTSRGPSIKPPMSSTLVRMQPIQGREGGRVDRRDRAQDGGGDRG